MNRKRNANLNQTMVKLGKIGITPAGEYDAGKTYDKLCLVLGTDGNSYLSTQESVTGVEPGVTEGWENYWQFLCGSGKGGGVQSDYAQNDETQIDYIKNRPGGYYKTVPAIDIQWDGVVGDKPTGQLNGETIVKVSDEILTKEQWVGASVTLNTTDNGIMTHTIQESDVISGDGFVAGSYYLLSTLVLEWSNGGRGSGGSGFTVPETGTYFFRHEDDSYTEYVSSLQAKEKQVVIPIPGELTNIKGGYDLPGKTEELYNGTIAADSWVEKETFSQKLESDVAVQVSATLSTYYEATITLAAELIDGATITGTVAGMEVSGEFWDGYAPLYTVNSGSGVKKVSRDSGGGSLVCVITQNSIRAGSAPGIDVEVQLVQTVEGAPVIIPAEYLDTAALETSISNAQTTANSAQTAADQAKTAATTAQATANKAATKTDPVFTGSFSQNRKSGTTVGAASHAEGSLTTASSVCSHAEGSSTQALGDASHAEGISTTAQGSYSHAEGANSTANGQRSHAEGRESLAQGDASHAEGYGTIANGNFSHAEGLSTSADAAYQHVEGCYNIPSGSQTNAGENKYIHIVGNGSSTSRSNAHTLTHGGVPWYQGRPQFGGTAMNDGAQTVVGNGDKEIILTSSTAGSTKKFKIIVDDTGILSATEVTS